MIILSTLDSITDWDKDLFLKLHEMNVPWLDSLMVFVSSMTTWYVSALLVAVFVVYRLGKKIGLWAVLFAALTIGFNAGLNNLVKYLVMRPRPINNEHISDAVRALEGYEDSYSFYSGHTTNSFCMAIFTILLLKNKYYTMIILIWATLVSYSRIYVGKHYPLDLLVGFVVGVTVGIAGYLIFDNFRQKKLEPESIKKSSL